MEIGIHRIISIEIDDPKVLDVPFPCWTRHVQIISKNNFGEDVVDNFTLFSDEQDQLIFEENNQLPLHGLLTRRTPI